MTQQSAVSTLYQWFKDNMDLFKSKNSQTEFRDSGRGQAYVRVDTADFMTEISVWDENYRLNSEIIDLDKDETTFPHTGDCETQEKYEQQLKEFIEWFEKSIK